MNRLPEVKAFLRRPGGVDQYPAVEVQWQLHRSPQLYALDDSGNVVNNKPIDLSHLKYDELHALFSSHFERKHVPPPHFMVRQWRRLFGWAYGISTMESTLLFVCAGILLAVSCYAICCRYTDMCDSIQDL